MKAIILAAGYATRLYPLTENLPKALLPIGEKVMLDYLAEGLMGVKSLHEIHIITNHRFAGQFEDWVAKTKADGKYSRLEFTVWDDGTSSNEDRLGAIGDMYFVLQRANLDDDVLVAASDNFFTFPIELLTEEFDKQGRDMLLAGRIDDIETLRRFAVAEIDESGLVTNLVEKPQEPHSDIGIYAMYVYKKDTIVLLKKYLDEGNNPDSPGRFPEWLIRKGHALGAYVFEGECVDIGTFESYREVCERFGK